MTVKSMIKDCLLHGNGFAYIERDKGGKPKSIKYLPFGECNIFYNKVTGVLLYQCPRISSSMIEPVDIIHLRMLTKDGINGISILDYANSTIKLGAGAGLAVLEGGMKYTPVSSNSKDAELLETRLFNVQEVARFFNISPVLLGDLSKSSYNSIEQAQLQFVINTLAPYIAMLEQEINNKLIMPSMKYNYYIDIVEEDIIKQDKQSQANYLNTLVNSGILTRNEARKKLGYPPVEGGDELTVSFTDVNQNKVNQEDKNTDENKDEEQ